MTVPHNFAPGAEKLRHDITDPVDCPKESYGFYPPAINGYITAFTGRTVIQQDDRCRGFLRRPGLYCPVSLRQSL